MSRPNRTKERTRQPVFMSIPSLAQRWDVSEPTIKRAIRAGSLRSVHVGKRFKIHVEEVARVESEGKP